jgi:hypothetical protein
VVRKKATTKRIRLEATHLARYHSRFTRHPLPSEVSVLQLCSVHGVHVLHGVRDNWQPAGVNLLAAGDLLLHHEC